jgi:hypothetical protein
MIALKQFLFIFLFPFALLLLRGKNIGDNLSRICYAANWWTLGEPKLPDSITPVSLNSAGAGAAICQVLPRLCFSAEFDKSKVVTHLLRKMAGRCQLQAP